FLYSHAFQGMAGLYFADLDSDAEERIVVSDSNAMYASPGYLLFLREGTLMAQAFDAGKGKTIDEAVPIAEQVGSITSNGEGEFSASQDLIKNAVLVYTASSSLDAQLTWYDRSGNVLGT